MKFAMQSRLLHPDKASSPGGLTAEFYKLSSDIMVNKLCNLFKACLELKKERGKDYFDSKAKERFLITRVIQTYITS